MSYEHSNPCDAVFINTFVSEWLHRNSAIKNPCWSVPSVYNRGERINVLEMDHVGNLHYLI